MSRATKQERAIEKLAAHVARNRARPEVQQLARRRAAHARSVIATVLP